MKLGVRALLVSVVVCVLVGIFLFRSQRRQTAQEVPSPQVSAPALEVAGAEAAPDCAPPPPTSLKADVVEKPKPHVDERNREAKIQLPPGTQLKTGNIDTPWEFIAPGDQYELFGQEKSNAFSLGLKDKTYKGFVSCARHFVPPAAADDVDFFEGELIFDIESKSDGYKVVNLEISDGPFFDASLESCLTQVYKGAQIPVTGVEVDRRYRTRFPITFAFRLQSPQDQPAGSSQ